MKRFLSALSFILFLATLGQAQIAVYDAMLYGHTDYYSDTTYGFPCSTGFADSHSGYFYGVVGPDSDGARTDITFGPTDESPNAGSLSRVSFYLGTNSKLHFNTTCYSGLEYTVYVFDENYNAVSSYSGYGNDDSFDVELVAGQYSVEYYCNYNMWSGGSLAYASMWFNLAAQDVWPNSYQMLQGTHFSGWLENVGVSDDQDICFFSDDNTLACEVQLDGTSPVVQPSELSFTLEGHVVRTGLSQAISLYNYATQTYDDMDSRDATLADETTDVLLGANYANYIGSAGQLSARILWQPINDEVPSQDGWLHCLDVARWHVAK